MTFSSEGAAGYVEGAKAAKSKVDWWIWGGPGKGWYGWSNAETRMVDWCREPPGAVASRKAIDRAAAEILNRALPAGSA